MKSLAVVYLQWEDSEVENGWTEYDAIDRIEPTVTVGLLVEERDTHYAIAHTFDEASGEYNGLMRIPRSAILKARTLCRVQMKTKTTKT
jgi:hypothetical protein